MKFGVMMVCALMALTFAEAKAAVQVRAVAPAPTQPTAYERIEWSVELGCSYTNPSDPEEIPVDATYTNEWWDTRTAEIIQRETASPNGRSLKVTIPPFKRDIALRVLK